MELADLPGHPARATARAHKAAVEEWLSDRLADGGLAAPRDTARHLVLLIEGALALVLIHGDVAYMHAAADAARLLVGADGQRR
jgi:hypothetical protein